MFFSTLFSSMNDLVVMFRISISKVPNDVFAFVYSSSFLLPPKHVCVCLENVILAKAKTIDLAPQAPRFVSIKINKCSKIYCFFAVSIRFLCLLFVYFHHFSLFFRLFI